MTSSTGRRSNSALSDIDDDIIAALRRREIRRAQILDGALPTRAELLSGLPPRHDDLQSDVMAAIDDWKARRTGGITIDLAAAAEVARVKADRQTVGSLRLWAMLTAESVYDDKQLASRCDVWLAYLLDLDAWNRCIASAMNFYYWGRGSSVDGVYRVAWATGMWTRRNTDAYDTGDADLVVRFGLQHLDRVADLLGPATDSMTSGLAKLLERQREAASQDDEERAVGQLEALLESGVFEDDRDETLTGAGIIVVPKMGDGVGGQKEVRKTWKGLAGSALPVVHRGDVAAHKRALVALYPHAEDVVDIMLRDLAPREAAWFRPTLIVGTPGSGKSSLLRAIADRIGLPCELNSLAGSTDSSAMGTSAQWSTVRESIPLQLIKRSRQASVCMIWDEVDKASSSRNNGSVIDALLPMLEPDQARRYRDLALEVEVDLSAVSHFATANDLDAVPAPLRDRFRILTMPEPTWAHLGTLTKQIIDRIAAERGIDSRFFGDLAEDELDLIKQAWPGGSIRQLTRIVTTIVDGRDQIMARC